MPIPAQTKNLIDNTLSHYKFGFKTDTKAIFKAKKGLSRQLVKEISERKNEPKWMTDYRLKALEIFSEKSMPDWGGDLSKIDLNDIHYYIQPQDKAKTKWGDVPFAIKDTFNKLGIPEAERRFLAGTGAQFESEIIYHSLRDELREKGVIFESTEIGLQKYPEIFREHFGKIVPATDNKFAALNSAVWSGGSFIYIPKGVHVDLPLHAYFRINAENMGQFERTLIIADEGASIHYIEGCTASVYSTDSLHAAVVEIIVKKGARVQYTTLQNWSKNVYNLVTKRAFVYKDAEMFWLDCNFGSKLTMKYPAIFLMEEGARGEVQSLAFAGQNQHQDAGAKIIHAAPNTSSKIVSKSISKGSGRTTYRGLLKVNKVRPQHKTDHAAPLPKTTPQSPPLNIKSHITCNALLLDKKSRSDTYPVIKIEEDDVAIAHEATVSKIGEEQLFYLMSRGLSAEEAASAIVNGFAEPIVKQLPMEYALELNRLLELEMSGSVG